MMEGATEVRQRSTQPCFGNDWDCLLSLEKIAWQMTHLLKQALERKLHVPPNCVVWQLVDLIKKLKTLQVNQSQSCDIDYSIKGYQHFISSVPETTKTHESASEDDIDVVTETSPLPHSAESKTSKFGTAKDIQKHVQLSDEETSDQNNITAVQFLKNIAEKTNLTKRGKISKVDQHYMKEINPFTDHDEVSSKSKKRKRKNQTETVPCNPKILNANQTLATRNSGPVKKSTQCKICDLVFPKRRALKTHMKEKHGIQEVKMSLLCELCGQMSVTVRELCLHIQQHLKSQDKEDKNDQFICQVCDQVFSTRSAFVAHTKRHFSAEQFCCEFCLTKFPDLQGLKRHRETHSADSRPYKCPSCGKGFKSQTTLRTHKMLHTGEQPYSCNVCGKRFIQTSALNVHKLKHTAEEEETKMAEIKKTNNDHHRCHICGQLYKSQARLELHIKSHDQLQDIRCQFCPKMFTSAREAAIHQRIHEKGRFHCRKCGEKFKSRSDYYFHSKTHEPDDRPHVCSKCGKSFATVTDLATHKRKHEQPQDTQNKIFDRFRCNICGKTYVGHSSLVIHMKIHTGQFDVACDLCPKRFKSRAELRHHRRVHTHEKPYTCDICQQKFARHSTLANHKRSHGDERPYLCGVCGAAFKLSNTLKKHSKIHSREESTQKSKRQRGTQEKSCLQHESEAKLLDTRNQFNTSTTILVNTPKTISSFPTTANTSTPTGLNSQSTRLPISTVTLMPTISTNPLPSQTAQTATLSLKKTSRIWQPPTLYAPQSMPHVPPSNEILTLPEVGPKLPHSTFSNLPNRKLPSQTSKVLRQPSKIVQPQQFSGLSQQTQRLLGLDLHHQQGQQLRQVPVTNRPHQSLVRTSGYAPVGASPQLFKILHTQPRSPSIPVSQQVNRQVLFPRTVQGQPRQPGLVLATPPKVKSSHKARQTFTLRHQIAPPVEPSAGLQRLTLQQKIPPQPRQIVPLVLTSNLNPLNPTLTLVAPPNQPTLPPSQSRQILSLDLSSSLHPVDQSRQTMFLPVSTNLILPDPTGQSTASLPAQSTLRLSQQFSSLGTVDPTLTQLMSLNQPQTTSRPANQPIRSNPFNQSQLNYLDLSESRMGTVNQSKSRHGNIDQSLFRMKSDEQPLIKFENQFNPQGTSLSEPSSPIPDDLLTLRSQTLFTPDNLLHQINDSNDPYDLLPSTNTPDTENFDDQMNLLQPPSTIQGLKTTSSGQTLLLLDAAGSSGSGVNDDDPASLMISGIGEESRDAGMDMVDMDTDTYSTPSLLDSLDLTNTSGYTYYYY